jgi:hypothetical protein
MDEIKSIILMVTSAALIRQTLIYCGQGWAKSYSQTIAFLILPIITYVITKTITGNIALSLGMIGALSIVRFRHPVKSALELIIYFDLITLGIATSVRTKWAIQLAICTIIILISVKIINEILKKLKKSFYNISFNEGNELNILEIHSSKKKTFENYKNLKSSIENNDINEFIYRFAFQNIDLLNTFKKEIEKDKDIIKIEIQIV